MITAAAANTTTTTTTPKYQITTEYAPTIRGSYQTNEESASTGFQQLWILALLALAIIMTGIAACWLYICRRRRKQRVSKEADTSSSDASSTDVSTELLTKIWDPTQSSSRGSLQKSKPLQLDGTSRSEDEQRYATVEGGSTLLPLYKESRGFATCPILEEDYMEDTTVDSEDDDSEGGTPCCPDWTHVDLVGQGVFHKTLETLKSQPRCVLCSVCYKVGDTVTVSTNPACTHNYHEECLTSHWQRQKTSKSTNKNRCCPVCRTEYIV